MKKIFTLILLLGKLMIAQDYQGPEIVSFTFSPDTINVSYQDATVFVTAHVTDSTGVKVIQFAMVHNPDNPSATNCTGDFHLTSGTLKDGIYTAEITIPKGKQPGNWLVFGAPFADSLNNGSIIPSASQSLVVINTVPLDIQGPEIVSFTFSPDTIDVSYQDATVFVTAHVTDSTGVKVIQFAMLQNPDNPNATTCTGDFHLSSGTAKDGIYIAEVTILKGKQPGNWSVFGTPFSDSLNNGSIFPSASHPLVVLNTLLPVELSSFVFISHERTIQLNWETKTEKNSDKFSIERKTIGADWEIIGSVKAVVLSNSPKQYSYTDKNLQSGKYRYRLKMIDNDGTFAYSKIIETEVALPKSIDLKQNYPNPFNPTTKIEYMLPSSGHVKMMVYDIKGALIQVLINETKEPGYYETEFNAKGLASGVYIYRIEVIGDGNKPVYSDMKKTILLK